MFSFSIFGKDADGNVPSGTLLGRLLNLVKESTMSNTKMSSTRLQSYFVLFSSLLYSVTFVIIEMTNAIMALTQGQRYVPSNESIIVLGMLLSHHLGVLFSKPAPYQPSAPVMLAGKETTTEQTTTKATTTTTATAVAATATTATAVTTPTPDVPEEDASTKDEYAEAI